MAFISFRNSVAFICFKNKYLVWYFNNFTLSVSVVHFQKKHLRTVCVCLLRGSSCYWHLNVLNQEPRAWPCVLWPIGKWCDAETTWKCAVTLLVTPTLSWHGVVLGAPCHATSRSLATFSGNFFFFFKEIFVPKLLDDKQIEISELPTFDRITAASTVARCSAQLEHLKTITSSPFKVFEIRLITDP